MGNKPEWTQDEIGGQYRNTRTGEVVNSLPATRHIDGHYGGYDEPVYHYKDRQGRIIETSNKLDAEFGGDDPWAHG